MFIKLDLTIRNLYLDRDSVEIGYGGVHNIHITLRVPTEEEQKIGHEKRNPFCIVVGEWQPNENVTAAFRSLAEMKMPKGSKRTHDWEMFRQLANIDQEGNLEKQWHIPLRFLPDSLASFIEQAERELFDIADRSVNVLRWRCGTEGEHHPISSGDTAWSFDGQNWLPLPDEGNAYMWAPPHVQTSNEILEYTKAYIQQGNDHPLGHELYLEAWEQRHENPRSALVIGIAAAETGLKLCISKFVPAAKWLIENTASPDLAKMLSEYLPDLPTTNRVNKSVFAPKSVLYETLRKGITMRNLVVHGRSTTIKYETLEKILLAVHDVLWILDYCSGYEWALAYIRTEVRQLLERKVSSL